MSESKTEKPRQFRQGDILLVQVKQIPKDATQSDDHVLARGEVTGHSHRMTGQMTVWRGPWRLSPGGPRQEIYLSVTDAQLVHDEHGPITIPPGLFQVRRQREYDPAISRLVMD